jgi:N-acetyl sugar amidotransferase
MDYCKRCVYPANTKPGIVFDEQGICSGCRTFEQKTIFQDQIDWDGRRLLLKELLLEHSARQRVKNNPYDCIIPVSGGKDSHYQTWLIRKQFGLNPLLVTYNHTFNTPLGIRNLTNLVEKLDCNLLRFSTAPGSAIRMAKYMLKRIGDVTWHYHAGIMTFPIRAAVQYDIPLVVWGEEGFSELVGMHNLDDFVEFTKKKRQEHMMRGFEPDDLLAEPDCPLTRYDLAPFFYPSDEDIERVGVRGIYLSNYVPWNARDHAEFVIRELGFESAQSRERTFNIYAKTDDLHANGLHDYLKYLKFGYGRATDDAANEIRHGRMTREQGIEMVMRYDHLRPSDMDVFLRKSGLSEPQLLEMIEPMRDPSIWEMDPAGKWRIKDHVGNHIDDPGVREARLPQAANWRPFEPTPSQLPLRYQEDGRQSDYVLL